MYSILNIEFVGYLLQRFFPGCSSFPLSSKTYIWSELFTISLKSYSGDVANKAIIILVISNYQAAENRMEKICLMLMRTRAPRQWQTECPGEWSISIEQELISDGCCDHLKFMFKACLTLPSLEKGLVFPQIKIIAGNPDSLFRNVSFNTNKNLLLSPC